MATRDAEPIGPVPIRCPLALSRYDVPDVESSRILRHKGPKYAAHIDSDGWASISRGGRERLATMVSCCRETETHMFGDASPTST